MWDTLISSARRSYLEPSPAQCLGCYKIYHVEYFPKHWEKARCGQPKVRASTQSPEILFVVHISILPSGKKRSKKAREKENECGSLTSLKCYKNE